MPDDPAPDSFAAYALDAARVRRSFDRAATTYDAAAVLHTEVRGNLLARLDLMKLAPRVAVDAGAGTGHASQALPLIDRHQFERCGRAFFEGI